MSINGLLRQFDLFGDLLGYVAHSAKKKKKKKKK